VDSVSYKTVSLNRETVKKDWIILDAKDEVLGRFSSRVAMILRGKHKTGFTPHVDCGDNVIIINAEKVKLTGLKLANKEYITHSGYPGGQKIQTPEELLRKFPTRIIEEAVRGMLPKNRLGRAVFKNLHVYAGVEHPHQAQTPVQIDLNKIK
jgi:large subunit ribosomal protein L13